MTERILFLMCYPWVTCKEYCEIFETSRRSYYRDKRYIEDRLFRYRVTEKKKTEGSIMTELLNGFISGIKEGILLIAFVRLMVYMWYDRSDYLRKRKEK